MTRQIWSEVSAFLSTRARVAAATIALGSAVVGALEAGVLVLVVSSALAAVDGADTVNVDLPAVGNRSIPSTTAIAVAAGASLGILVVHAVMAWMTSRVSAGALHRMRRDAVEAFARASWSRQALEQEGGLQETTSTLSLQSAGLVMHFGQLAMGVAGLTMLLGGALVVSPVATGGVLGFGALVFLALRPITAATRRSARSFRSSNSRFNESMSTWSALAMDLRVFGVQDAEVRRLSHDSARTSHERARTGFLNRFGSNLFKDVAILGLVLGVGAIDYIGQSDIGSMGAVVLLVVRSLTYAQVSNAAIQSINEQGPNLEELNSRLASLQHEREVVGTTPIERISELIVAGVDYDYEVDRAGVRDLSLRIEAGETVGVIGPSGGGKSTLVQILLRLRPPTRGRVLIDGVDYLAFSPDSWHRLVSLVPQEPRLFAGSVRENITFLREGFTRAEIESAAEDAHVADDIRALPNGFDTVLGPRGSGLSGGQKQRIAIARALLGKPHLLVLDEPTSALDVRSEQLIRTTIDELKGDVTLVIIAHRLSTLQSCDRVVAMEGGRIKLIGSLEEALAQVSMFDVDDPALDTDIAGRGSSGSLRHCGGSGV